MKRILIVTATLGFLPVQLALAAPLSAAVSQSGSTATEPSNSVPAVAPTEQAKATVAPVPPSASPTENPVANAAQPVAPAPLPAASAPSSSFVEPSPYGPSAAEQNQKQNRERFQADPDRPATLFDPNGDYAFGGMGGVAVMYTRFANEHAVLVCGEGAVIIDHTLTLGGGGCGVTRTFKAQDYSSSGNDEDDRLSFGYGGVIGRYHFRSREIVNLSVGALVGAGGVSTGTLSSEDDSGDTELDVKRSDAVFVFEPQFGAHVNITRWLRVGAVVGYRLVSGVDTKGLTTGDVAGLTAGGQLQGGWF